MTTNHIENSLDELLHVKIPVLDDGFISVVDYMGDDQAVDAAARVSYGEGTRKTSDMRGLIRYLMRHQHTSPFEMCEIKMHVRLPITEMRQWVRHRTASVNEYSGRYSIMIDRKMRTDPHEWRLQSAKNKQGSDGFVDTSKGVELSEKEWKLHVDADILYRERLSLGVAREQARKDLPLSNYTEMVWKIDLKNLLHFVALRKKAQHEISQYADIIHDRIIKKWVPVVHEAFNDYVINAITLSSAEQKVLKDIIKTQSHVVVPTENLSEREKGELLEKVNRILNML